MILDGRWFFLREETRKQEPNIKFLRFGRVYLTMSRPQDDRNQEATVYLVCSSMYPRTEPFSTKLCQGNLDERCTDALIWELMLQAGPVGMFYARSKQSSSTNFKLLVVNVHLPKDRISMAHQGYGFSEFLTEEDAEYACKIMNQIKLWGKPIRVNKVRYCN